MDEESFHDLHIAISLRSKQKTLYGISDFCDIYLHLVEKIFQNIDFQCEAIFMIVLPISKILHIPY